jgi:hypothetical protein
MKIEIHTLAHQQVELVPYVMRNYEGWADVIAYAGYSTDGTEQLLEKMGAKVVFLETHNEANDQIFMDMKNNCWKGSRADWVIVTDFDELVYHKISVPGYLSNTRATLIRPLHYEMYSDSFPVGDGKITDYVKDGAIGSFKFNTFRPSEIKEMNFGAGCHHANPIGNIIIDDWNPNAPNHLSIDDNAMFNLHYRNLGKDYVYKRNEHTATRLAQINKDRGWGTFVYCSRKEVDDYYDSVMKHVKKVI